MRYRRKFRSYRIALPIGFALLVTARDIIRSDHFFWMAGLVVIVIGLWVYIEDFFQYWEIRSDRLIDRRLYRSVVFPFTEITYVGPVTDITAGHPWVYNCIEIRNAAGKKLIIQPADCDAFLAEMRKYLPQITLNR